MSLSCDLKSWAGKEYDDDDSDGHAGDGEEDHLDCSSRSETKSRHQDAAHQAADGTDEGGAASNSNLILLENAVWNIYNEEYANMTPSEQVTNFIGWYVNKINMPHVV